MAPPKPRTQTRPRYQRARAFRHGELVCGRVDLRVRDSGQIGLTAHERREIVVRFLGRIAPELRRELDELVQRRGSFARRAADRMQAIELVADDPQAGHVLIVGHVQPPQHRHCEICETEFGVRVVPEPGRCPSPAGRALGRRIAGARWVGARDDA
ncbi:MAG: hypothetical protein ACR2H2_13830 [Solirubrobacteraceae bacterium]